MDSMGLIEPREQMGTKMVRSITMIVIGAIVLFLWALSGGF